MEFSGKVGNGPMNKRLNFAGDPDHRLHTGIVFRIRHYWDIHGKWLTGINLLLLLISQMAVPVKRALRRAVKRKQFRLMGYSLP